jgi:hypothetical protein
MPQLSPLAARCGTATRSRLANRSCSPPSRLVRLSSELAIAEWVAETSLPERFGVKASALNSQH